MTKPMLTAAQQRALDWLPADGCTRISAGRMAPALSSLERAFPKAVRQCWQHSSNDGEVFAGWRLTPAGVAMFHPEPDRAGESK